MIPVFNACLVCEAIRPELNGKLIVLGLFGICPHVNVFLQHLDQPAVLTFLISGGPGDRSFLRSLQIVDEGNQRVVAESAPASSIAFPNSATQLVDTLLPTFGHGGQFSIRCLIDGVEQFRADFSVSQGPAPATP